MRLTPEQEIAVDAFLQGRDFKLIAGAGCGKTATLIGGVEELAKLGTAKKVLFLEYNRALVDDVRAKIVSRGLQDAVVVTNYDSILVRHYDPGAGSYDFELSMHNAIENDRRQCEPLDFDVLVVDEGQDLTDLRRRFIRKIVADRPCGAAGLQTVVIGDPCQTIYRYQGASAEYLLSGEGVDVEVHTLSQTFRFGEAICDFSNQIGSALFESFIRLRHVDRPSEVVVVDYVNFDAPPEALVELIDSDDAALLAATLRPSLNPALAHVCRALAGKRKTAVNTVYTSKGKEWDVVVLFLTSDLWTDKEDRGALKDEMREVLYVGLTRAVRRLIVLQDHDMVFSAICGRLGLSALASGARSAARGAGVASPPVKVLPYREKYMSAKMEKMDVKAKNKLVQMVRECALDEGVPGGVAPVQPVGDAIANYCAWKATGRCAAIQPILDVRALPDKAVLAAVFARLGAPFAPDEWIERALASCVSALPAGNWAYGHWRDATVLSEKYLFGCLARDQGLGEEDEAAFRTSASRLMTDEFVACSPKFNNLHVSPSVFLTSRCPDARMNYMYLVEAESMSFCDRVVAGLLANAGGYNKCLVHLLGSDAKILVSTSQEFMKTVKAMKW